MKKKKNSDPVNANPTLRYPKKEVKLEMVKSSVTEATSEVVSVTWWRYLNVRGFN